MSPHQLQVWLGWFVPTVLIAFAGIGLILLRSELRNPGMPLFRKKLLHKKKKQAKLLKFVSRQERYRKAS